MYLRSIEVLNYRAIAAGRVSFEHATVLFGENDSGRSSILEAMMLVLGGPGEGLEERLRPHHFHRMAEGKTGPMHIRLRIAETTPGQWDLPERLRRSFPAPANRLRDFDFDFQFVLDPADGTITTSHTIVSSLRPGFVLDGDAETREWVRALNPMLWLKPGSMTGSEGAEAAGDNGDGIAADPELRRLMLHRERLLSGTSPDLAAELDAGARAAQAVLDKHGGVFADAGLLMSAMAAEILDRKPEPGTSRAAPASDVAGKLSLLLLLGAIIRLARRRAGANARPILVIENPESNLHPMTLASVWRITERIVWQKIIATNSGTILASAPLGSLRRLTRSEGIVTEWSVTPRSLSREAIRRVSYHLRSRRAAAMFARCWILVEGETEYWILPELARICGYDLGVEGVTCVEFAQCGLPPLIKLADQLGIASHVLVDGDTAGDHYADSAGAVKCARNTFPRLVTKLKDRDIEHCFWQSGFAEVIRRVAYPGGAVGSGSPSSVIRKAIERTSKPFLALSLIDAAARRGAGSVPAPLREVVESAVRAARGSVLHRIR